MATEEALPSLLTQLSQRLRIGPSSPQDHLERLRRLLRRIQAVLYEAAGMEIRDESTKLWLCEIKDVAYEADDVLDEYEYELLRAEAMEANNSICRGARRQKVSNLNNPSSFWDDIISRVGKITDKFDEISDDRAKLFHLREVVGEKGASEPRSSSSLVPVANKIFGRDEDTGRLKRMILGSPSGGGGGQSNPAGVICVVGMGGVGKTTLVQGVYKDPEIREGFELRGWVCVSDGHVDVVKLTKDIKEALTKNTCDLINELSVVQKGLFEELSGKRFLLVLDDVWNEDQMIWDSLQVPLLGLPGSTIIVTTRSEGVARMTRTAMPLLRVECLPSFDDCWAIFQHRVALPEGGPNADDDEHRRVGKEIVKKCRGLPLGIAALGGLLRWEPDIESWEQISQSEIWGALDEDSRANNNILPSLMLSYIHLPTYLKRCFAYCAVFKKDYVFGKEELVQLWMAQGLIITPSDGQLEETGVRYVDELLRRSLFQPKQIQRLGSSETEGVVMHDLVHELAVFVSQGECTVTMPSSSSSSGANRFMRHVAFDCSSSSLPPGLRTLLKLDRDNAALEMIFDAMDQKKLDLLRALKLEADPFVLTYLPASIGNLKHLRFLSLDHVDMQVLPESVCQLYLLQTLVLRSTQLSELPHLINNLKELRYLDISFNYRLTTLPEIGNLQNLRHLNVRETNLQKLPDSIGKLRRLSSLDLEEVRTPALPRGIGRLTNLQYLPQFLLSEESGCAGIEDLRDLNKLTGKLCIKGLCFVVDPEHADRANLRAKTRIDELILDWGESRNIDRAIHSRIATEAEQTDVLEKLKPHTRVLHVLRYRGNAFPRWMGDPSFSRLTVLKLEHCSNSRHLPALGLLPSLEDLTIRDAESVERVGAEFHSGNINNNTGAGGGQAGASFPSLKTMAFYSMTQWKEWEGVKCGDFSQLECLMLIRCRSLRRHLPNSTYSLPMLMHLRLYECHSLEYLPLHNLPGLQTLAVEEGLQRFAVEDFGDRHGSSLSLSSSTEEHLQPSSLTHLYIGSGFRYLLDWCKRSRSLVRIPDSEMWVGRGGSIYVRRSSVNPPRREPFGAVETELRSSWQQVNVAEWLGTMSS